MQTIALVTAAIAATFLIGCHHPSPTAISTQRPAAASKAAKPVQILVKFKAGLRTADLKSFRAEFGTRNVGEIKGIGVFIEEVVSRKPVQQILDEMNADPLVEYAELNGEVGIN